MMGIQGVEEQWRPWLSSVLASPHLLPLYSLVGDDDDKLPFFSFI